MGDGRQGYAEGGPYNAIHVGAAAPTLPEPVSISAAFMSVFNNHTILRNVLLLLFLSNIYFGMGQIYLDFLFVLLFY